MWRMREMPFIRGSDGKLYDYAEYEDKIKPLWKEKMKKEVEE
jgi:hypothetical protein